MFLIAIIFISFLLSDSLTNINPLLSKKGLKFNANFKGNLIGGLPPELSPVEIDLIKAKAKNFIPEPATKDDIVVMETNFGIMEFELYPEEAPNHSYNFKKLANSGFYDETIFHRIIPGFMAQGGDILTRDLIKENDGRGNPGWTVNQEFNNISHIKGILSMARGQDANSAGSQFFICFDNAQHLNNKYTVFGKLINGYKVLDKIENLQSEADYILDRSNDKLPDNSKDDFLEFNYKNKKRYIKIPRNENKNKFKDEVYSSLKNIHRTRKSVKIIKVRVRNENIENISE
jgi:cyclophilin family peptidyl-prolyl cis-trans isomerase